jgi:hypothetical protein
MEWNYDPVKEQYEIYENGEKKVVIPEEAATKVKAVVSGLGQVPVSQVTPDNSEEPLSGNLDSQNSPVELSRADMPEIPGDAELRTDADKEYYNRLVENPTSQPSQYRRAIRARNRISRIQFDEMAKDMGYDPDAGAHNASLLMLERIGEINRDGRGDNQTIYWTGE